MTSGVGVDDCATVAAAVEASPGTDSVGTTAVSGIDGSGDSCGICGGDNASGAKVGVADETTAGDELAPESVNACAVGGKDVAVGEAPSATTASLSTTDSVAVGTGADSVGTIVGCCSCARGSPPMGDSLTGVGVEMTRTVAVGGTKGVAVSVSVAVGGMGVKVAVGDVSVTCDTGVKVAVGGATGVSVGSAVGGITVKVAVGCSAFTPATCVGSGVGENVAVGLGSDVGVEVAVDVAVAVGVGAPLLPISARQSSAVNGMAMPLLSEKTTLPKAKLAKPAAVPTKEIRANSPLPLFA